eukprot:scaffold78670_cov89-Phaeocystis_antarctica.AAC.1
MPSKHLRPSTTAAARRCCWDACSPTRAITASWPPSRTARASTKAVLTRTRSITTPQPSCEESALP